MPCIVTMALATAAIAAVLRYSSTTKQPATSALRNGSLTDRSLLPMYVLENVLSVNGGLLAHPPFQYAPFTKSSHIIVDARYLTVMVYHAFCAIPPPAASTVRADPTNSPTYIPPPILPTNILSCPLPFPKSIILSKLAVSPENRTTATIVRPPFVAIFNVCLPASMYCDLVRSKKTWPLPFGPPVALYVGRLTDPTAAFMRFGTDANEGVLVNEMNVSHDKFEYGFMTHSPVNPATHVHTVLAASEDWFCAHVVHGCTPVMFLNLPASQPTHARAYTTSKASVVFSTCV
jgi:hypothetical protein